MSQSPSRSLLASTDSRVEFKLASISSYRDFAIKLNSTVRSRSHRGFSFTIKLNSCSTQSSFLRPSLLSLNFLFYVLVSPTLFLRFIRVMYLYLAYSFSRLLVLVTLVAIASFRHNTVTGGRVTVPHSPNSLRAFLVTPWLQRLCWKHEFSGVLVWLPRLTVSVTDSEGLQMIVSPQCPIIWYTMISSFN